ncbi:2-hydroxyacyl-CoA dehydratase [Clostridium sp. NSJ-6]|uniref:2-hydroxyacyl-CoA dehydratase n=1 Tax=Clostridium hominis TaxID=2763036 RepID=A0ABR7DDR6_9CLOT|nr:2-hydroxyacyl-CoA dehydratase family protein [Clostridium hominis]MBC5629503.1 2-hydroxyacyl-CoA dehydratase [Clostridium hominis]MDU2670789.1 2-hydroxyacyl-CoA dehydratase family protein [Clostridium sp.]
MAVNELLNKFHDIATSPKKQLDSFLAEGKKVVACVPVYTPEEIIHSMGLVPFGTWGADVEVKEAKRYFPAFICSIMQSVLELGMNGDYEGVSAIVIPSLCDSLKCLGQNWKYAVENIPFVPMTYPQNRNNEVGKTFTKVGYERVIKDLENITGAKFSEEELSKSVKVYNKHNKAMREISKVLVDYPSITASQRSDIFKSAYFMLKEDHTKLVNELIEELGKMPKETTSKIKVVTSGILVDNKNLLEIFDANDIQIVADDVAHESRQYRVDALEEGNALESLAEKFANMGNCSVLYDVDKKRADYVVDLVKEYNAEGVIFVMTKFCDPEEFDYVIIKKACDSEDIMTLQIEVDRQMVNYGQANTAIQTFREMLEVKI